MNLEIRFSELGATLTHDDVSMALLSLSARESAKYWVIADWHLHYATRMAMHAYVFARCRQETGAAKPNGETRSEHLI